MLWIDTTPLGFSLDELAQRARQQDITLGAARVVIHHQISSQAVDDLIKIVNDLKAESSGKGLSPKELARSRAYAEGVWDDGVDSPAKRLALYGQK